MLKMRSGVQSHRGTNFSYLKNTFWCRCINRAEAACQAKKKWWKTPYKNVRNFIFFFVHFYRVKHLYPFNYVRRRVFSQGDSCVSPSGISLPTHTVMPHNFFNLAKNLVHHTNEKNPAYKLVFLSSSESLVCIQLKINVGIK